MGKPRKARHSFQILEQMAHQNFFLLLFVSTSQRHLQVILMIPAEFRFFYFEVGNIPTPVPLFTQSWKGETEGAPIERYKCISSSARLFANSQKETGDCPAD